MIASMAEHNVTFVGPTLELGKADVEYKVLQDGTFYRVGGHSLVKVDVRIIAATNQNLEKAVADGRLKGNETINAQMVLTIGKIGLNHKVDGQI